MNFTSKGSPVLRWGRAKIVEVFGADLRSLAAFRIVLALLVLADLANRHTDYCRYVGAQRRRTLVSDGRSIRKKIHHDEARRADEVTVERQTQHHAIAEDEPRTLRSSLSTNLLVLLFLLYVFFWNLTTVSAFTIPERVVPLGTFLGLNQSWDMFAPYSAKNDGWYVIPGTLRNGQQVDLMPAVTHYDFYVGENLSWENSEAAGSSALERFTAIAAATANATAEIIMPVPSLRSIYSPQPLAVMRHNQAEALIPG